jgi:hypothetical protein
MYWSVEQFFDEIQERYSRRLRHWIWRKSMAYKNDDMDYAELVASIKANNTLISVEGRSDGFYTWAEARSGNHA